MHGARMQSGRETAAGGRKPAGTRVWLALLVFATAAVSYSESSNKYSHAFYVPPQQSVFLHLARKSGTDKVSHHFYEHLYSKYLETSGKRFLPLKMMEIGLGVWTAGQLSSAASCSLCRRAAHVATLHANARCDMQPADAGCTMKYGPGRSAAVWREYLPASDVWFAEYDAKCVEANRDKLQTLGIKAVIGDQANHTDLQRWVAETGGNFDVIVDDGGHNNRMQWNSFKVCVSKRSFPQLTNGCID
jgi:hypothetical protein